MKHSAVLNVNTKFWCSCIVTCKPPLSMIIIIQCSTHIPSMENEEEVLVYWICLATSPVGRQKTMQVEEFVRKKQECKTRL